MFVERSSNTRHLAAENSLQMLVLNVNNSQKMPLWHFDSPYWRMRIQNALLFTVDRKALPRVHHPRRPRGSQSGREKRRDECFQVRVKEPLGSDFHWTISKNSSGCRLLIGHKNMLCITVPNRRTHLLTSFRVFALSSAESWFNSQYLSKGVLMFYFVASPKEGTVVVIIRRPTDGSEVGRTLYHYYRDEMDYNTERIVNCPRVIRDHFKDFCEEQTANQGRGTTNAAESSSFGKHHPRRPRGGQSGGRKCVKKVFKHGRKSPWVPTLTGPFPNGQANAGSWLGTKNALYYCAQSANSISWVLFVSSYTTAIDSITACLAHAPKKCTQSGNFQLDINSPFQNTVYPKTKGAFPKIQAWTYNRYTRFHRSRLRKY